ncbi:MAG: formylglycine-generating enzyme family protein, partial [Planctomycetota bacterium]
MDFQKFIRFSLIAAAMCAGASLSAAAPMPTGQSFTNSLGMKFVLIKAGEFTMGGLHDELPAGLAN